MVKKKETTKKKIVSQAGKKVAKSKKSTVSKTKTTKKRTVVKKTATKKVIDKKVVKKEPKKSKVVLEKAKTVAPSVGVQSPEVPQAAKPILPKEEPLQKEQKIPLSNIEKGSIVKEETPIDVVKQDEVVVVDDSSLTPLEFDIPITVKDLSVKIGERPSSLIKYLIEKQKTFVTINQGLEEELVLKTLRDFGFKYKKRMSDEELLLQAHESEAGKELLSRPPVITFMGHVDHGKTSLLDAVRRSKVVDKEHGGITQHMGAYKVNTPKGEITFLDTPGHEAFTAMRARGANITDIVILVVAADDGIMPQTVEAIDHAKAAGVPIVVAINKIDKQNIDIDKVKRQLAQYDLTPEDWGGKIVTVGVSAKTGQGISSLLEMISLEAEMLELKSAFDTAASGVVVEARLCKGQGAVVTVLVQSGTLKVGDNIICGVHYGKIRAMINDLGERINSVTPGSPAEILGFSGVPEAGEKFHSLNDEKKIKAIVQERQSRERQRRVVSTPKHISLEDLYLQIQQGAIKELNIVLKADVQGSLEAVKGSLDKIESSEVKLNFLHSGVGPINSSDVILAEASNAVIIGFHVSEDSKAKELASAKKVEIRTYRVIYELISEIKAAMEGLLEPRIKKNFMGKAEIRRVFNLSRSGLVAGCFVQKGKIVRQATANLVRGDEIIFEGVIAVLKRFKDDVREVQEGFECGISLDNFTGYKEGDFIVAYSIEKIARVL